MKTNNNSNETFHTCIRYAWNEPHSPKDEDTLKRVKNLISFARTIYNVNFSITRENMLNEINELEIKLQMGITK